MFIEIRNNIIALNNLLGIASEGYGYSVNLKEGEAFYITKEDYFYIKEALKGLNQLVYEREEE